MEASLILVYKLAASTCNFLIPLIFPRPYFADTVLHLDIALQMEDSPSFQDKSGWNLINWCIVFLGCHYYFMKLFLKMGRATNMSVSVEWILTRYTPTLQNGQTHSNNSSAIWAKNCLSVFDHFVGLALKGLRASNSSDLLRVSILIFSIFRVFLMVKY